MSFPKYERYKDSGVEWLGEVPEHWDHKPLWIMFQRVKRTGYPNAQLLSIYRDFGVIQKSSREDNFNKPSDDLSAYQLVEPGDLVINKMKAWQGSVAISYFRGIVSPAYHVYRPKHEYNSIYLHHLFRCVQYIAGYLAYSKGIRVNQWDLDPQQHSRMTVLLPPNKEQAKIAQFLDYETGRIDALIGEQERLIALLKEKRQAVISHAVTKGLDPNAPLKDSGIDWLGQIPAHWKFSCLKRFWSVTDCKHLTAEFIDEGIPLASIREVQSQFVKLDEAKKTTIDFYEKLIEGDRKPEDGDLIFSRNATVGEVAQVADWHPPFAMGQDVCLLRKNSSGFSSNFLYHVLRSAIISEQLKKLIIGATFKRINVEEIKNLMLPMPPYHEQIQISTYAEEKYNFFDDLLKQATYTIELLQERRSALISAAVTGKIDLRHWQPPTPNPQ